MIATASPAVAERIGLEPYHFVKRQTIYLLMSIFTIIAVSFTSSTILIRSSFIALACLIGCLIAVLFIGAEIKGAKRWLSLGVMSIQPSEFLKPFYAVVNGWILAQKTHHNRLTCFQISIALYILIVVLLFFQPDFGMIVTYSTVWGGQLFLAGISLMWILSLAVFGVMGILIAYLLLPHVSQRINNFLDPSLSENYQVKKSIAAFMNGGLFGKGPGEGTVKQHLPDSHTDFIFSVIGEELGVITCAVIIFLYCFVVIRGLNRIANQVDLFSSYSVAGLLIFFGIQSLVNMGVTLNLLPTKGMTLPFISYGGSSVVAVSITIGIILALTRKRYGNLSQCRKKMF
jgi:cell division protein FtsW